MTFDNESAINEILATCRFDCEVYFKNYVEYHTNFLCQFLALYPQTGVANGTQKIGDIAEIFYPISKSRKLL